MRSHLDEVCRMGHGAWCCKYLMAGRRGLECAKHEGLKQAIDNAWAGDPTKTAQGDNCDGQPIEILNADHRRRDA